MYKIVLPERVEYFPSQVYSVTFLLFSCYSFFLLAPRCSLTLSTSAYTLLSPFVSGTTVLAVRSVLVYLALVYSLFVLTTSLALVYGGSYYTWLAFLVRVILLSKLNFRFVMLKK